MLSQYLVTPFFKLNIANHNKHLCGLQYKDFFKQCKNGNGKINSSILGFIFKSDPLILLRGGLLGLFQLSIYKEILTAIDASFTLGSMHEISSNKDIREYMCAVKDNNQILHKLQEIGYFDKEMIKAYNPNQKVYQYRNILISSILTSSLIALCMTPIDILSFNYTQQKTFLKGNTETVKEVAAKIRMR